MKRKSRHHSCGLTGREIAVNQDNLARRCQDSQELVVWPWMQRLTW